eukprot:4170609-Lingulodinium_polyedra.AAC.1
MNKSFNSGFLFATQWSGEDSPRSHGHSGRSRDSSRLGPWRPDDERLRMRCRGCPLARALRARNRRL